MTVDELRRKWTRGRGAALWPAAVLILVQTINGAWYGPQVTFFPVYLQEQLWPVAGGDRRRGLGSAGGRDDRGPVRRHAHRHARQQMGGGLRPGVLRRRRPGLPVPARPGLVAVLWFAGGAGLALITGRRRKLPDPSTARAVAGALASLYMLSFTGGVIGNPIAGAIIQRRGFTAFGLVDLAVIGVAALIAVGLMVYLGDRSGVHVGARVLDRRAPPMTRRAKVRLLMGLTVPADHLLRHADRARVAAAQQPHRGQGAGGGLRHRDAGPGLRRAVGGGPGGRSLGRGVARRSSPTARSSSRPSGWRSPPGRCGGCSCSAWSAWLRPGLFPRSCTCGWPTASQSRSTPQPSACCTPCGASA